MVEIMELRGLRDKQPLLTLYAPTREGNTLTASTYFAAKRIRKGRVVLLGNEHYQALQGVPEGFHSPPIFEARGKRDTAPPASLELIT